LEKRRKSFKPSTKKGTIMKKRYLWMYYVNSISALKQLLFSGPPPNSEQEEQGCSNKKNVHCHITKKSQNKSHMRNAIEYCSVEVTCEKGSQYGIQAYGDEERFDDKFPDIKWNCNTMQCIFITG
jgi:hypothetical protein